MRDLPVTATFVVSSWLLFHAENRSRSARGGARLLLRVHRRAMACRFEIVLAAEDLVFVPAATKALDEIDRLEDELSSSARPARSQP